MRKKELKEFLIIFAEDQSISYKRMKIHSVDVRQNSTKLIYRVIYEETMWGGIVFDFEVTVYLNPDMSLKEINMRERNEDARLSTTFRIREIREMIMEYKLKK